MEIILGNTLNLNGQSYQNYDLNAANFLPFGFSGAVINRNGDNVTASLAFPNTQLTRPWASDAINGRWVAIVSVRLLNTNQTLYSYTGQVSAGGWDETAVKLELSTVLDAVGSDVPFRSFSEDLVGPLPTSAGVRMF
jgi:hypothetical protein